MVETTFSVELFFCVDIYLRTYSWVLGRLGKCDVCGVSKVLTCFLFAGANMAGFPFLL